jgi:hypothetical protein
MKNILQLFQPASQSDSTSDTGWENQRQNLNTDEATWTENGSRLSPKSSEILSVSQQRTQLIAQTALNKLFTDNHFSICKLNEVMNLVGKGRRNSKVYKQLHALHCVNFEDMPEELRNQLPYMVNELLTNKPAALAATNVALNGVFE